jgi:hypothetical protein
VRVERSFVCRKADVATYRKQIKVGDKMPNDDGAPAIDGLYIFPDPQETTRDDGFVEFRVTAYGRSNETGQRLSLLKVRSSLLLRANYRRVNLFYSPTEAGSESTINSYLETQINTETINVGYKFCVLANKKIETPKDIREIGGMFLADTDIDLFSQSFTAAKVFPVLDGSFVPPTNKQFSPVFSATLRGLERLNFGSFDEIVMQFEITASPINFGSFFQAGSVPAKPEIESVESNYNTANVKMIPPPYSSGVRITIGGITLSAPYGGSATGSTFSISGGTPSVQYITIRISGLTQNTVYSASIAVTNENGSSASASFQFLTKSFSESIS